MTCTLPLPGPARDIVLPLALHRAGGLLDAALCLVDAPAAALRDFAPRFLHAHELERLDGMKAERRAHDFLAGRYAAKRALARLRPDADPRTLCIGAGVFGQPILQSRDYLGLQVSISHGAGVGAALVTPEGHPMAIDIEHIDAASREAIASQMTDAELAMLAAAGPRADTLLWTMKEALSKVLRCGLTTPFTLLELERVERSGAQLAGTFRHFTQYRAVAIDLGAFACAVVLPRATQGLALDALAAAFSTPDRINEHYQPLAP